MRTLDATGVWEEFGAMVFSSKILGCLYSDDGRGPACQDFTPSGASTDQMRSEEKNKRAPDVNGQSESAFL